MDFNKLTENEKKYARAIIECIDDGIFITDGEGTVIDLNANSLGCQKRENIIGRNMRELIEAGIYRDSAALRVIEEKKPVSMFQYEETDLLTTAMPYMENGTVKMVVCCEREIHTLEAIERELEESLEKNSKYEQELLYIRAEMTKNVDIIAESPQMRRVVDLAITAASFDSRVLIQGDTGTGKEVIAKLIYSSGKRKGKPFIAVNCSAIPETLLESELFGYEKGAFTGANDAGKKGFFELAHEGVLFLDEIGEVSLGFQVKLLRAIQENEIIRVGGSEPIKIDVQIIAATNKDLLQKVEQGEFRADLYYRLNVFPIKIPALKERKEEIMSLVQFFSDKLNKQYGREKCFSPQAMKILQNYAWPGNIRELENVVERLMLISQNDVIKEDDVTAMLFDSDGIDDLQYEGLDLEEAVAITEKNLIKKYMEKYRHPAELEKALGVSRATLNRKINKYGLR
ncbi:sigma 54-interacting transcriptional regulator [Anaerovorax odorimutans]|uniref:HTH-type transcriptional regulatory protein TyrR n=1 Tax=Anaerovorax odorimutans TaxID=109327 RepID=A0ABT1RMM1_9FIRM|nr:sigma 54-interacting transcriptional regulator [Anaerovorax odorimutans]MCQ4636440.1 sigma 54-interacting transcriptional regulator [Anaerovorax odorimutans]